MAFIYQQSLIDYMKKHDKQTIVVEMVEINNSDFEISNDSTPAELERSVNSVLKNMVLLREKVSAED